MAKHNNRNNINNVTDVWSKAKASHTKHQVGAAYMAPPQKSFAQKAKEKINSLSPEAKGYIGGLVVMGVYWFADKVAEKVEKKLGIRS